VDKPLKSMTDGQCDIRPTVTFPVTGHQCPVSGTKLHVYCFVTAARVWTTCQRLLFNRGSAGSWTWVASQTH